MKVPAYGASPTIVHRNTHRDRSVCHLRHLADAFPDAGLAPPPGDPARGPYYRWLFFAAGPVEAAMSNKSASTSRRSAAAWWAMGASTR